MNRIKVVAAVRQSEFGQYWVCRRTADGGNGGLAGMWEYPGGKVEPGESLTDAMHREMKEEFGVDIKILRQLDTISTEGFGKLYEVTFFEVIFLGKPELRVHDLAAWFYVRTLLNQQHLPSGMEFNRRLAERQVGLL